MAEGSKALEGCRAEVLKCSNCGFCQAACPVYGVTLRPSFNARGKMLLLREVLEGRVTLDQELAENFYCCTECQACTTSCAARLRADRVVRSARRTLHKQGFVPQELLKVEENVFKTGNVFGGPMSERVEVLPPSLKAKTLQSPLKSEATTLLFMGCLPSYLDMKIVPSFVAAMERGGIDFTVLGAEEECCGLPLYLSGSEDFELQAAKILKRIKATRAKQIITPCAGCYKSFKELYPSFSDLGIEVLHSLQFLESLVMRGSIKLTKELPKKVTYHDPCDLGRGFGIFEEPRRILKRIPGLELVEMDRNRTDARCCGGGGSLQVHHPHLAVAMAEARVRDALAVGAEIIVSACPACKDNFRKGLRVMPKAERKGMAVLDIVEIVERCLP